MTGSDPWKQGGKLVFFGWESVRGDPGGQPAMPQAGGWRQGEPLEILYSAGIRRLLFDARGGSVYN